MVEASMVSPAWRSWPVAFAEQARCTPFAAAISEGGRSLTYQEFTQWCAGLAGRLVERGVTPGDVVGVPGGPSPLAAAVAVACWQIGAVYLPLDLDQPTGRLRYMLDVASPVVVMTGPGIASATALAGIPTVTVDPMPPERGDADSGADVRAAPPAHQVAPDDPAYINFTSGSSGTPKGVLVGHRGILGMATALADALQTRVGARMWQFAPTTFDASIAELTLALCTGATAVFVHTDDIGYGDGIADAITAHGISHLIMVPSVLATVPEDRVPAGLSIVVAGERPSPAVLRRWRARHRVRNAYGPTEATVCTTISEELDDSSVVPMGRVIHGCTVEMVDQSLQPAPPGTVGELLIGGDGVALGYLRDPTQNQERFITRPDGARWYRSGDLVRELPDGQLEFVGRRDRQIKLRGRRIEPDEVEAVLLAHPDVRSAAVVATDEQLLAYAVVAGAPDAQALVRHLTSCLPRYLTPDRVIPVDHFPHTAHGKINYAELLRLTPTATPARAGSAVARSPQEHLLCRLFAEVLGRDQVSPLDGFFELGGQSMLAAELARSVRATLGIDLSMQLLLAASSPAALAAELELPGGVSSSLDVLLPLRRSGQRRALFCVHPATGLSWGYAGLLRSLPDRPIVGLQARALSDPGYQPESVEELAADYLSLVTEFQSAGPYHLLGWSFGGRVAFEMAAMLQRAGGRVGSVVLMDTSPPPPVPFEASTENFDRDQALRRYFLTMLAETTPIEAGRWENAPLLEIKAELDRLGSPYALLSDEHFQRMFELQKRNYVLSRKYVPSEKLRGRMVYVSAVDPEHPDRCDPQRKAEQWAVHVDGLTVEQPVKGTHNGLTEGSSLAEIGNLLAEELERNELITTGSPTMA